MSLLWEAPKRAGEHEEKNIKSAEGTAAISTGRRAVRSGCRSISLAIPSVFLCSMPPEGTGLPDIPSGFPCHPAAPSLGWERPPGPRGQSHFEPRCTSRPSRGHPHPRPTTRSLPSHRAVEVPRLPSQSSPARQRVPNHTLLQDAGINLIKSFPCPLTRRSAAVQVFVSKMLF